MAKLRVGLVTPEREIWTGEADEVTAKTTEGGLGILPGHAPVLGVLTDGSVVRVKPVGDAEWISAMVGGGFLSVAENEVSVLAEVAELGEEIDVEAAREELRRAADAAAERRARARLQAAGLEV